MNKTTKITVFCFSMFFLFSCGVKGRPLPPLNLTPEKDAVKASKKKLSTESSVKDNAKK